MSNRGHYQRLADAMNERGALCQDIPEVFFPEDFADKQMRERAVKIARNLCAQCPIRLECFEYAVETKQTYGIWAGTLPHER